MYIQFAHIPTIIIHVKNAAILFLEMERGLREI